ASIIPAPEGLVNAGRPLFHRKQDFPRRPANPCCPWAGRITYRWEAGGTMANSKVTVPGIVAKKQARQPIVMVTAYDATMGRLVDAAGVDMVLVGDSLAMVVLGHDTTLPVTMEEMLHHTRAVRRGVERALVVADMPFGSYQGSWAD